MNFLKNRNNRSRLTVLKNEFVVMGSGKGGIDWEFDIDMYTLLYYIFYFWLCWVIIAVYKLSLIVVGRVYSLVAA